jgi:hypothetical protein
MPTPENRMSEQESLKLISEMIQKAKTSYHDKGISALLWGTAVFIAAIVTFAKEQFGLKLPFDIWFIVLFAIVPQVIISVKESKNRKVINYDDRSVDIVWMVYGITIFGLVAYHNIVPHVAKKLIAEEGWQLVKHMTDGSLPDAIIAPFTLSTTSIFILVYTFPTLITGLIKKCKPMIFGAILSYGFFIASLFTAFKYDMLLSAATALFCWFIPGVILRIKYLKSKAANV